MSKYTIDQLEKIKNIINSNFSYYQSMNPLEFKSYNFTYDDRDTLFEYRFDTNIRRAGIMAVSYSNIILKFDTTKQGVFMLELCSTNPYYEFCSNRINEYILPIDIDFFKILDKVLGLVSRKPGYISDFKLEDRTRS